MIDISYEDSLRLDDSLYVDVRSPSEFSYDHIPGALNLPIFDDDERKEIGILYRHAGRNEALIRGTRIGSRKIADIVSAIDENRHRNLVIYCARGGMRSSSVASLVSSLGFNVYRIIQGYKGYRRYIVSRIDSLHIPIPFFVLQGLTGTGKTELIRNFAHGIDLEAMAGHRSSIFGGIGLRQNSQKRFESLLIQRIDERRSAPFCFIEGESRKIGNLHIPPSLYKQMKGAPVIYIQAPMERRVRIINDEYSRDINDEDVISIVRTLKSKLGNNTIERLVSLYNEGAVDEFISILLEKYYDPLYEHSLKKMDYIGIVHSTGTEQACSDIINIAEEFIRKRR